MNNWKPYNSTDFKHLNNNVEVKTNDGKVHSIWNIVGGKVLKFNGEEIATDDILFWREKKDWNRLNRLQKHNELLEQYDFEKLDDLEYVISFSCKDEEKVEKLFKKLKKHIEVAQQNIRKESETYLKS